MKKIKRAGKNEKPVFLSELIVVVSSRRYESAGSSRLGEVLALEDLVTNRLVLVLLLLQVGRVLGGLLTRHVRPGGPHSAIL